MSVIFADRALLSDGWAQDVQISIGTEGSITSITQGCDPRGADWRKPLLIPAMPNLHSHAFQRAFAGLAEAATGKSDSFWTWRHHMYAVSEKLTPETNRDIAAALYIDMLKAGYTQVAEFHYIHNHGSKTGTPGEEMARSILIAAQETGIGITLLPTLYETAGFDDTPLESAQKLFALTPDQLMALFDKLNAEGSADSLNKLGFAFHSLRAVRPESLIHISNHAPSGTPIHIHIAEQEGEVDDCIFARKNRPVAWLYDKLDVNKNWCLIHATHISDAERQQIGKSGAIAGLCPTTEANLGDGLFPIVDYLMEGGAFGIGSDSQVTVDPTQELRLLEYGQRLTKERRATTASEKEVHTGARLWRAATTGGAQACGINTGEIAVGKRADFLALDTSHQLLTERNEDTLLDTLVFCGGTNLISDVMVAGNWTIIDRHHALEDVIEQRAIASMKTLLNDK